ncbi:MULTISPECIES: hypothetical protein [Legionella]|nr:hypothetical protein [Legionella maceachernii]
MTVGVVVPNVVRDLLGGASAKSWEVLRVAQDDSGIAAPHFARDDIVLPLCL